MPSRFHLVTLGCPKNAVDSDKIAAALGADGLTSTDDVGAADLVVVNTCAFIEDARRESIDTVLALADARRRRAPRSWSRAAWPSATATSWPTRSPRWTPSSASTAPGTIGELSGLGGQLPRAHERRRARRRARSPRAAARRVVGAVGVPEGRRRVATARVRSARSRRSAASSDRVRPTSIVARSARPRTRRRGRARARRAGPRVVRTRHRRVGRARAVAASSRLPSSAATASQRVRLLYLYPSEVKDPLVSTMLELDTVVPYFDLSLQHASRRLLKRMARWGSGDRFLDAIDGIRDHEPDAAFRSSFIVGLPRRDRSRPRAAAAVPRRRAARLGRLLPVLGGRRARRPPRSTAVSTRSSLRSGSASAKSCRPTITQAARDALVLAEAPLQVLVDDSRRRPSRRPHAPRSPRDRRRGVHRSAGSSADLPAPGTIVAALATGALGPDLTARAVAAAGHAQ